jgi:hypothetical protein
MVFYVLLPVPLCDHPQHSLLRTARPLLSSIGCFFPESESGLLAALWHMRANNSLQRKKKPVNGWKNTCLISTTHFSSSVAIIGYCIGLQREILNTNGEQTSA